MTVQLFNALQNQIAEAEMSVVGNEFHATFTWQQGEETKTHVVKFPKVDTTAELKALIDKHNAVNVPKVLAEEVEAQNAEMNDILGAL
jgi:hypothetical protein